MEALVLLGLVGAGYLINKDDEKEQESSIINNNILKNIPLNNSVYDTNNFENSLKEEKLMADKQYMDMHKENSNIKDINRAINNTHRLSNLNVGEIDNNSEFVYSEGMGGYVKKTDFLTNDQGIGVEPYFKGRSAPLIDLSDNKTLQIHQGGFAAINKKNKKETPNFFKPAPENIYGNYFNGAQADKERYIAGPHRTNELPFEQEKIIPIDVKSELNRDIDQAIANTKSVDALRTLNNQKVSYEGRVIRGEKINKRSVQANVDKNRPYRDYKNSPARNLVTVAEVTGPSQRPTEILPDTNRQYLNRTLLGAATPLNGVSSEEKRPLVARSTKQQLCSDTTRNMTGEPGNIDYDRLGYEMYPNEREVTSERTHLTNVGYNVPAETVGLQDKVKKTIKQTTIDSANNGYVNSVHNRPEKRPYDKMRTGLKETTIELNRNGIAGTYLENQTSRQSALNSNMNPTKEIIAQGREPTKVSTSLWIGKGDLNVDIKKMDKDYMTRDQAGIDKVYQKLPKQFECQITRDKFKVNDAELLLEQINPELLTPFKENPFTKSLSSFAYA
jgi:hypothetical protein